MMESQKWQQMTISSVLGYHGSHSDSKLLLFTSISKIFLNMQPYVNILIGFKLYMCILIALTYTVHYKINRNIHLKGWAKIDICGGLLVQFQHVKSLKVITLVLTTRKS